MSLVRSVLLLIAFAPAWAFAQELCDNAMDDDADGLIDLNDPDCPCSAYLLPAGVVSYVANPSFEDRVPGPNGPCCPYTFVSPFSPPWLSCATGWFQATSATSDYYHMCGFAPPSFPLPPPEGEAAVGFISVTNYKEYVGSCIFDNPLLAGTEYTLSLWTAGLSISNTEYLGNTGNIGVFYEGEFPLTLWGRTDCVPVPIATMDCIGYQPGWVELGRATYQPDSDWLHVSMTFTPDQEIRMIMVGAPCDLPATYTPFESVIDSLGFTIPMSFYPYTLVDDLTLTVATDQVLTPVTSVGRVCEENVVVTALPPAGATDHQWYLNGVAILGQTNTTLNASALGLGGGLYTMASTFEGQCLMGNTSVWDPRTPDPGLDVDPLFGCAPLEVDFADTTGEGSSTVSWTFGDGGTSSAVSGVHTYTAPGEYDVTLSIVSDEGCTAEATVTVTVAGILDGAIAATPNPTDVENTTVQLSSAGSQGDIIAWWWDLGDVAPGTSTDAALTVQFPAVEGAYPVLLAVESSAGCVDTVRSSIIITELGVIEMPNVFSPNGDGRNDRFIPLDYAGTPGLLEVFNRWGQLVFSTNSLAQGWSGNEMPDGTYYYVVTPEEMKVEKRTGHVTLVR
jgi:gliding motility-associated-like protein